MDTELPSWADVPTKIQAITTGVLMPWPAICPRCGQAVTYTLRNPEATPLSAPIVALTAYTLRKLPLSTDRCRCGHSSQVHARHGTGACLHIIDGPLILCPCMSGHYAPSPPVNEAHGE